MALTAPAVKEFKKRPLIPAGLAVARCYLIADLGLQRINWQGEEKIQRKVQLYFEIPKHRSTFQREGEPEKEGPRVIGQRLTLSMHPKATLRKTVEAWFGKSFPDDTAAAAFDVEKLIGKTCMLNIVHNTKGDETYANLGSISPIMEGVEVPPAELPQIVYTDGNPDTLAKLPNFIQELVAKQVKDEPLPQEVANSQYTDGSAGFDDDIPF